MAKALKKCDKKHIANFNKFYNKKQKKEIFASLINIYKFNKKNGVCLFKIKLSIFKNLFFI